MLLLYTYKLVSNILLPDSPDETIYDLYLNLTKRTVKRAVTKYIISSAKLA